jgi:hypothetical protein
MVKSLKALDLQRDPRCVLHSVITDGGEGELKLYGRALRAPDQIRDACREGWWTGRASETAAIFSIDIEEAVFIAWDIERGEMIVRRWPPRSGVREERRSYP